MADYLAPNQSSMELAPANKNPYEGQILTQYNPTWRDRLATGILNLSGQPVPTEALKQAVQNTVGSLGAGTSNPALIDLTPAGNVLSAQEEAKQGNYREAAMAMMPGAPAITAERRAAQKALNDIDAKIRGYHSSPYAFDEFDISKVGTGVGQQSYGHGLYVASEQPTAVNYLGTPETRYKRYTGSMEPREEFAFDLATKPDVREFDVMKGLVQKYGNNITFEEAQELAKNAMQNRGYLYEVEINSNPEHFLHWDRPLPEQNQDALMKLFQNRKESPTLWEKIKTYQNDHDTTLGEIYENIAAGHPHGYKGATEWFHRAGIPGIKYADVSSKAAEKGSTNYVVFDDKTIEILRRYGLLPPVAAAGYSATQGEAQAKEQKAPQAETLDRIISERTNNGN